MIIVPRSLFVVCCLVGQACASWTFGVDNFNYVTIFQKSGIILPLHKTTRIRLEEPPCLIIKFVHVTVNNRISTPMVSFDKQTVTVYISYAYLAGSMSSYEVIGKGVRIKDCNQGNRVQNFQSANVERTAINKKMKANHNYQYNGVNGQTEGNVLGGSGDYAGGYHEGASRNTGSCGYAGNGGGHEGGGGYTGSGNYGGGSGYTAYDGHGGSGGHAGRGGYKGSGNHGGAGGHPGDSGYSGYGNHGGNNGGHAGSGGHGGNSSEHGGGGGYVGSDGYGGSASHNEGGSVEVNIDEHYDLNEWHGANSDNHDTATGIHINEIANGSGKYSPNTVDFNEYGWDQLLAGGKGKKALPRGKFSTIGKKLVSLHSGSQSRRGTFDNSLLGRNYGGGSGFGGGSGYDGSNGYGEGSVYGADDDNGDGGGYGGSSGYGGGGGNHSDSGPGGRHGIMKYKTS